MEFAWDHGKSHANVLKHGVSFELAASIFRGVVLTRLDTRESYGELREISIGCSTKPSAIVVVVVHTERNGVTRLISARRASPQERRNYDGYCSKILG